MRSGAGTPSTPVEHFQAKWMPVRRQKMRSKKEREQRPILLERDLL
jgi:hypothetical protein